MRGLDAIDFRGGRHFNEDAAKKRAIAEMHKAFWEGAAFAASLTCSSLRGAASVSVDGPFRKLLEAERSKAEDFNRKMDNWRADAAVAASEKAVIRERRQELERIIFAAVKSELFGMFLEEPCGPGLVRIWGGVPKEKKPMSIRFCELVGAQHVSIFTSQFASKAAQARADERLAAGVEEVEIRCPSAAWMAYKMAADDLKNNKLQPPMQPSGGEAGAQTIQ